MLLVSTARATNQMSKNMLVLIYTTQSIDIFTCCGKPEKNPIHSSENKFWLLTKAKKSENYDRKMFLSGLSVCRAELVFAGPISAGPNDIRSDHVCLSHRWPKKAQASLGIHAVSPEPSLFAHMKYESRRRVWPKIRHLAPLDGCPCAFEEWVYGRRKEP